MEIINQNIEEYIQTRIQTQVNNLLGKSVSFEDFDNKYKEKKENKKIELLENTHEYVYRENLCHLPPLFRESNCTKILSKYFEDTILFSIEKLLLEVLIQIYPDIQLYSALQNFAS